MDVVARCVGATFGPGGRAVAVGGAGRPVELTRDGAAVGREIHLEDPFARQGAELVKQAANRVADRWGDGSTTATLLTAAILRRCIQLVEAGHSPTGLAADLECAAKRVVAQLRAAARPATPEEIRAVALAACLDPRTAELVAGALQAGGADAAITVCQGRALGVSISDHAGFRFDRGLLDRRFAPFGTQSLTLENPAVCVADLPLTMGDVGRLIGRSRWIGRPLLLITEPPGGPVVEVLAAHAQSSDTPVVPVPAPWKGPRRRDFLDDLAAVTGATVLLPELLSSFTHLGKEALGSASVAVIESDATTLVVGQPDDRAVAERLRQVDADLQKGVPKYERDRLLERKGRLAGRSFVVSVGAPTDQELRVAKRAVRSAIAAGRAAAKGGVVAGGSVGLWRAAREGGTGSLGSVILEDGVRELIRILARNAGRPAESLGQAVPADGTFDLNSGNWTTGPEGPWDAAEVIEASLEASVSLTKVTLGSEGIVLVK
ncbi:MAG: TCP-1/cpn60 chaperonin family protein [Actinomycetota bacterium]